MQQPYQRNPRPRRTDPVQPTGLPRVTDDLDVAVLRVAHSVVGLIVRTQVTDSQRVFHTQAAAASDAVRIAQAQPGIEEVALGTVVVEDLKVEFSAAAVQAEVPARHDISFGAVAQPISYFAMSCQKLHRQVRLVAPPPREHPLPGNGPAFAHWDFELDVERRGQVEEQVALHGQQGLADERRFHGRRLRNGLRSRHLLGVWFYDRSGF